MTDPAATLADAVREFLAVSDQQATEGRALVRSEEEGALDELGAYLARWQPKIEANWAMLRSALDTFDAEARCRVVIGKQRGEPVACGAVEAIHGSGLGMVGGHTFEADQGGGQ